MLCRAAAAYHGVRPLKLLLVVLLSLLLGCGTQPVRLCAAEFQSWYHGYYMHSVWGLGVLSGYSGSAYVLCGTQKVPIRAIFDTHVYAGHEPKAGETKADATKHNEALLAMFARSGVRCFIPEPEE